MIGIDVSNWQGGSFNWDQVKRDGYEFAIIKVGENFVTDGDFARNWSEAGRVRLLRGGYYYCHPSNDPVAEGRWFAHNLDGAWRLAGDFEDSNGLDPTNFQSRAVSFLETVSDNAIGHAQVDFYSYRAFIDEHISPAPMADLVERFGLWIAAFQGQVPSSNPWGSIDIWQNADSNVLGTDSDVLIGPVGPGQDGVEVLPRITTDIWLFEDGTLYKLKADGGVEAVNTQGKPAGFYQYTVLSDDGHSYTFGPGMNGGVFAYPGLPADEKLDSRGAGVRQFIEIRAGGAWQ